MPCVLLISSYLICLMKRSSLAVFGVSLNSVAAKFLGSPNCVCVCVCVCVSALKFFSFFKS